MLKYIPLKGESYNAESIIGKSGIYAIYSDIQSFGKKECYIGQSKTLGKRFLNYHSALKLGNYNNQQLQKIYHYNKHLYFSVLQYVDIKYLDLAEQAYIQHYVPNLNRSKSIIKDFYVYQFEIYNPVAFYQNKYRIYKESRNDMFFNIPYEHEVIKYVNLHCGTSLNIQRLKKRDQVWDKYYMYFEECILGIMYNQAANTCAVSVENHIPASIEHMNQKQDHFDFDLHNYKNILTNDK